MKPSDAFEARLKERYPDDRYPELCKCLLNQMRATEDRMDAFEKQYLNILTAYGRRLEERKTKNLVERRCLDIKKEQEIFARVRELHITLQQGCLENIAKTIEFEFGIYLDVVSVNRILERGSEDGR